MTCLGLHFLINKRVITGSHNSELDGWDWHFHHHCHQGFKEAFCPFPGEYFLLWRKVTVICDRVMRELRAPGHRQAVARAVAGPQGAPVLVSGPASLWLILVQALLLCFSLIPRKTLP